MPDAPARRARTPPEERPAVEDWHAAPQATDTPIITTGLNGADLALIDAFLSRRESLEGRVRRATASQILDRLKERLPEDADLRGTPESVLEALSVQMRSSGRLL